MTTLNTDDSDLNINDSNQKIDDSEKCPKCGDPLFLRRDPPKLFAYIVFIVSFILFIAFSSGWLPFLDLSPKAHYIWTGIQIMIGIWAGIERIRNQRTFYRCRRCSERIK